MLIKELDSSQAKMVHSHAHILAQKYTHANVHMLEPVWTHTHVKDGNEQQI